MIDHSSSGRRDWTPKISDLENAPELGTLGILWAALNVVEQAIPAHVGEYDQEDLAPEHRLADVVLRLARLLRNAVEEYRTVSQRIASGDRPCPTLRHTSRSALGKGDIPF
jgi:hypothetical protein